MATEKTAEAARKPAPVMLIFDGIPVGSFHYSNFTENGRMRDMKFVYGQIVPESEVPDAAWVLRRGIAHRMSAEEVHAASVAASKAADAAAAKEKALSEIE